MPNPMRLEKRFALGGATFIPVSSIFEPVVTPPQQCLSTDNAKLQHGFFGN